MTALTLTLKQIVFHLLYYFLLATVTPCLCFFFNLVSSQFTTLPHVYSSNLPSVSK